MLAEITKSGVTVRSVDYSLLSRTWYPPACFVTLSIAHEVVGVSEAATVAELFTALTDSVVKVTFVVTSAWPLVHFKETHICKGHS